MKMKLVTTYRETRFQLRLRIRNDDARMNFINIDAKSELRPKPYLDMLARRRQNNQIKNEHAALKSLSARLFNLTLWMFHVQIIIKLEQVIKAIQMFSTKYMQYYAMSVLEIYIWIQNLAKIV